MQDEGPAAEAMYLTGDAIVSITTEGGFVFTLPNELPKNFLFVKNWCTSSTQPARRRRSLRVETRMSLRFLKDDVYGVLLERVYDFSRLGLSKARRNQGARGQRVDNTVVPAGS